MKTVLAFLICLPLLAQRPSNPALLVPQTAPELNYAAVPDPLALPAGPAPRRPQRLIRRVTCGSSPADRWRFFN